MDYGRGGRDGTALPGLYPPNDETRARYNASLRADT